jgi:hypothetical protein
MNQSLCGIAGHRKAIANQTITAPTEKGKTMTDREKLISILLSTPPSEVVSVGQRSGKVFAIADSIAEYLLSNGVTFAKDTNVPSWIPVSERLPEKGQSGVFPDESINVLVYREYYDEIRVGHYDYHWNEFYTVDDLLMGRVTHWMQLPEPPKE